MSLLTYEAALDPHHAVFRILCIRQILRTEAWYHEDTIRICDFYWLYPDLISQVRLMQPDVKVRRALRKSELTIEPYGERPSPMSIFRDMKVIQLAALETLLRANLLTRNIDGNPREIAFTSNEINPDLRRACAIEIEKKAIIVETLIRFANDYPLKGSQGLKDRTGLLEHRYD